MRDEMEKGDFGLPLRPALYQAGAWKTPSMRRLKVRLSMRKLKVWLPGLLVLTFVVMPIFAQNNNAGTANGNALNATGAEAGTAAATPDSTSSPTSKPASAASAVSVAALLDALLKKGVLTPSEVKDLRNAAPETELQLLVEALTRKGVLDEADLSTTAAPAASPAPALLPQAVPVPQPELVELKPAAPSVVPAIVPVRVLALDPPKSGGLVGLKVGPVTFTPYGFIKGTAEQDSSSPNGDDFPIPAGLMLLPGSNTGPNADPSST